MASTGCHDVCWESSFVAWRWSKRWPRA